MGLDGISPIQIRQFNEPNAAELNAALNPNQSFGVRAIDGLSEGQKVDPDKERNKQQNNQNADFNNEEDEEYDTAEQDEKENEKFNSYKLDLSQTNKYELKVNENSNSIVIVEKATQRTVQVINADNLAIFVRNLIEGKGALVNRKF